ncbi:MAG: hypothetical protein R3C20_08960 [Planctomycetaceae bacterium]
MATRPSRDPASTGFYQQTTIRKRQALTEKQRGGEWDSQYVNIGLRNMFIS